MLPTQSRVLKDASLPRHFQVRQILLEMMTTGIWPPGGKIPAETEIARALGVSKMTVNKAILALTAEGLLYREVGRGTFVSPGARALEARHTDPATHRLQIITLKPMEWLPNDTYTCALLLAMRRCIGPSEVELSLRHVRGGEYVSRWREGKSDGWLLLTPLEADVPGLHALAEIDARAIILGASWPDIPLPSVDSDNRSGMLLAVEHLVTLGHRHIGLLYGAPPASNTRDRIEGFKAAMRAQNLPLPDAWMVGTGADWGIPEERRADVRDWLLSLDRPTAIVAAGAFLAHELLKIALQSGLRVPQDLSIVSFDEPSEVLPNAPELTTVLQPLEEMGRQAIRRLYAMLQTQERRPEPLRSLLPCQLVARASTGPTTQ